MSIEQEIKAYERFLIGEWEKLCERIREETSFGDSSKSKKDSFLDGAESMLTSVQYYRQKRLQELPGEANCTCEHAPYDQSDQERLISLLERIAEALETANGTHYHYHQSVALLPGVPNGYTCQRCFKWVVPGQVHSCG